MHKRYATILDMSNKIFALLSLGLVCTLSLTGCGKESPEVLPETLDEVTETQVIDTSKTNELAQDTALSNPATVYCLQEGGEFVMKKTLDGATEGFCVLPNNITCEVWAHYQGDCPTKQQAAKDDETKEDEEELNLEEAEPEDVDSDASEDDGQGQENAPQESVDQEEAAVIKQPAEIQNENELELSVEAGEESGELVNSWATNGVKAPEGFYVMLSGDENIEYPTKYTHELKNTQSRSFVWTGLSVGKTYYFRICTIAEGKCSHYSPVVSGTVE